tara:strand:+ start:4 stop:120 length:117 start_codon:yes stop_codon:yes gene_type:complete
MGLFKELANTSTVVITENTKEIARTFLSINLSGKLKHI